MTSAMIEHAGFEQGQMVLACTPDAAVLIDDSEAPIAQVNQLLTAIADGDNDVVRVMLIDACLHGSYGAVGAVMRVDDQWLLVLSGATRCTIRTATSHLTVDARPGEFEQQLLKDVEQVAFYPNQDVALGRSDGTDLLAGAVRAGRATVTMAAAATAAVLPLSDSDGESTADTADDSPAPTTRFAFDPMTGEPIVDARQAPQTPLAAGASPGDDAAPSVKVVAELDQEVARPPAESAPVIPAPVISAPVNTALARAAPAEPATPPAAASAPGVELFDLLAPAEPRVALDVGVHGHARGTRAPVEVLGVRCPVDHHNHPDAVYCAQCGRRMGVNHTIVAKPGPRPPLGLLLVDDGSTFSLVSDVIVGRDPSIHADVIDHDADSLRIGGDVAVLSRAHVGVYLDGWSVTAVDLGSANGTMVRRQAGQVMPLSAEARTMLQGGDTLLLGDREIRLELHHVVG